MCVNAKKNYYTNYSKVGLRNSYSYGCFYGIFAKAIFFPYKSPNLWIKLETRDYMR